MKRLLTGLVILFLSFIMVACQSEEAISFSDEQLETSIRAAIDKPDGEIIKTDLDEITELDLSGSGIKELDGIDKMDALVTLSLQDNEIIDFTPLTKLASIQEIDVSGNPLKDKEQQAILQKLEDQGITIISTPVAETVGRPDGPGGFLWKVENGNTTVYLQGTIHAGTQDFYPMNEKIEQAYMEADVIVPEIDMTTLNPLTMQKLTMELGTYQDRSTIEEHISKELLAKLKTSLKELGVPFRMVKNHKPWLLSTMIQQFMTLELGFDHGVDFYFLDKAVEDEKDIIALETAEDQLHIFADTTPEYQAKLLEDSLVDIEDFEKEMKELFSLYKAGNSDDMLSALFDESEAATEEDQAFMEAINDQRNYKMAEKIAEFLEDDDDLTYFVIVGSLHLIQEPHIISILEEKGFTVKRIL